MNKGIGFQITADVKGGVRTFYDGEVRSVGSAQVMKKDGE
jgi:hypothetical protein